MNSYLFTMLFIHLMPAFSTLFCGLQITLALLLGSDYSQGIRGLGPVCFYSLLLLSSH